MNLFLGYAQLAARNALPFPMSRHAHTQLPTRGGSPMELSTSIPHFCDVAFGLMHVQFAISFLSPCDGST